MSFYEKYIKLCNENKQSPSAAAVNIGLSKPTVTAWKNGGSCSDATKAKVADYFGVPVSYFSEENETTVQEDSREKELNDYLEMLRTRSEIRMLLKTAKGATKEDVERNVAILEALIKHETN